MRIKTTDGCIYEVDRVKKTKTYVCNKQYSNEFFFYNYNGCVAKIVFHIAENREAEMLKMEKDLFEIGKTDVMAINLMK